MIELRDYQSAAIAASEASSARTQLTALPTGTGKTVVFSSLVRTRGGTALILAHRDELLQQAEDKLRTVAPELAMSIGRVQATRNDTRAQIVVASVQTLASRKRLAQLPTYFETVVIDEAHHATAASYGRVLEHVAPSPLVAGFTATAERADGKSDLRNVFEELVYARSLESMIREGYLCDLRALRVELAGLDLSKVKKSRGDYQADALGAALEQADAVDHAVAAYLEHAYGLQTVAFFPTVDLSRTAAAAFTAAGVKASHVDGTTPPEQRRALLRDFAAGRTQVVCNVNVLTEGFDEPSIGCIIIALPTKSRIRYAQMVGRGTRLHPGKTECLILDIVGVTSDLSLQSVGLLFGLRKPPKPTETATQAVERQRAADEKLLRRPARPGKRRSPGTRTAPVRLFNRDAIPWCHVGDRWIVSLHGDTHIVLDPVGDTRHLSCRTCGTVLPIATTPAGEPCDCGATLETAGDPPSWRVLLMSTNRARVVARNLDLGYAQGAAETTIRQAGYVSMAHRDAPWRQLPATPAQVGKLRRFGISPPADATRGDAADIITTAIATERLRRFDVAVAAREYVAPVTA